MDALTASSIIYQELVSQFRNNATLLKVDAEVVSVDATVHGRKVYLTEQVIREVLKIDDQPGFPTEITMDQISEIVVRLDYEGVFPPTIKKLLPPTGDFWSTSL